MDNKDLFSLEKDISHSMKKKSIHSPINLYMKSIPPYLYPKYLSLCPPQLPRADPKFYLQEI